VPRLSGRPPAAGAHDDLVQAFTIAPHGLRGRAVRLGDALDRILARHAYPTAVAGLLGELLVLAATLASTLKFDGVLSLQTKSEGPVRLLVADYATGGRIRGYAAYDADAVAAIAGDSLPGDRAVPRLVGAGHLAFTVDQGADTERYQGIVELTGATLVDCVHHYFRQSEQIATGIRVAVDRVAGPGGRSPWRGGAVMIQRLPEDTRADPVEADDHFRHVMVLLASCRAEELLAPGLPTEGLLHRLFHEEEVRVFPPSPVADECRCNAGRARRILESLTAAEREECAIDGEIIATCEFCGRAYRFPLDALAMPPGDTPPGF